MTPPNVRLISWDEEDAARRARELQNGGIRVDATPLNSSGLVSALRGIGAICIDIDRLPSHGRELATAIRNTKSLRDIPIVFAGGQKDKILSLRRAFPDAAYVDWGHAASALRKVLVRKKPPAPPKPAPVVPPGMMARYSGRGLQDKLGITPDIPILFIGAPDGFKDQFGDLKESRQPKLTLWFTRSHADLEREIELMSVRVGPAMALWIIYPKQGGKQKSDLTQANVRAVALAAGLVDYKVCSVDDTWTGLKFAKKK